MIIVTFQPFYCDCKATSDPRNCSPTKGRLNIITCFTSYADFICIKLCPKWRNTDVSHYWEKISNNECDIKELWKLFILFQNALSSITIIIHEYIKEKNRNLKKKPSQNLYLNQTFWTNVLHTDIYFIVFINVIVKYYINIALSGF